MKCDDCLKSRLIISENGTHHICSLSSKTAMKCLSGEKDQYVGLKRRADHAD